ncbi:MAG: acyl-CoA-binding protein [Motiliproteus sp.]
MNNLKQKFEDCISYVQGAEGTFKPSNELKLEMYGLFKQATNGDVSGDKPRMTDFINRAKYSVWESCQGLSPEQAMQRYVDRIEQVRNNQL